jgi:hypothetical protein
MQHHAQLYPFFEGIGLAPKTIGAVMSEICKVWNLSRISIVQSFLF